MTPTHTTRGVKRYRYYGCTGAHKKGAPSCPTRSVPAGEVERVVVDRLRAVGRDPAVLAQTVAEARLQDQRQLADLEAERRTLGKDLARWNEEIRRAAQELGAADDPAAALGRLAELQQRVAQAERRLVAVGAQTQAVRTGLLHEDDAAEALARFGPVWEALARRDRSRLVRLVLERADYDGANGCLRLTFHPTGIRALADEAKRQHPEERTA